MGRSSRRPPTGGPVRPQALDERAHYRRAVREVRVAGHRRAAADRGSAGHDRARQGLVGPRPQERGVGQVPGRRVERPAGGAVPPPLRPVAVRTALGEDPVGLGAVGGRGDRRPAPQRPEEESEDPPPPGGRMRRALGAYAGSRHGATRIGRGGPGRTVASSAWAGRGSPPGRAGVGAFPPRVRPLRRRLRRAPHAPFPQSAQGTAVGPLRPPGPGARGPRDRRHRGAPPHARPVG